MVWKMSVGLIGFCAFCTALVSVLMWHADVFAGAAEQSMIVPQDGALGGFARLADIVLAIVFGSVAPAVSGVSVLLRQKST